MKQLLIILRSLQQNEIDLLGALALASLRGGPTTAHDIVPMVGSEVSYDTVIRRLNQLQVLGLVERYADPCNKRRQLYRLTGAGQEFLSPEPAVA